MTSYSKYIFFLTIFLALPFLANGQDPVGQDPIIDPPMDADTVHLTVKRNTSAIRGNISSGVNINIRQMDSYPKFLGNSDPLRYIQSLPGITSNTEMTTGIRVQGCEASQTGIFLCGTPVYGNGHILGLSPMFTPSHLVNMTFKNSEQSSSFLGAYLNFETPDSLAKKIHGDAVLGPISTQGTIAFQTGQKSSLSLSARRSFMDIFYKDMLKIDGSTLEYTFYDFNGSWIWKPDAENTIDINGYYGNDNGYSDYGLPNTNFGMKWGNGIGNIRWRHDDGDISSTLQIYGSSYWSDGDIKTAGEYIFMTSGIRDIGVNEQMQYRNWDFGAKISYYSIQPQDILLGGDKSSITNPTPSQSSMLSSLIAGRSFYLNRFTLHPSVTASLYRDFRINRTWYHLDPSMRVEYNLLRFGTLGLDFGYKHQYLFQTGITNSGFPIEFWMSCGNYCNPQSALFASFSYELPLPKKGFSLSAQVYGRKLYDQIEYDGKLSDIISGNYNLSDELLHGDGYSYGFSLMLQKTSGKLTGWLSYSYGRSLRSFDNPEYPDVYPSAFERLHELNAVASYKLGRWEFGGNLIVSSGLPYTPAKSLYVINNDVMLQYGEHNSKRLAPFIRLDVSATFRIRKTKNFEDKINISALNLTARENQLMARIKYKDGKYSYSPVKMVIPIIPSISYQCRF